MSQYALCLNTGSSSLKFALYDRDHVDRVLASGSAGEIGSKRSHLKIEIQGKSASDEPIDLPTLEVAFLEVINALRQARTPEPAVCAHRVVHGGANLSAPVLIDDEVKRELERISDLAPLHIPDELKTIAVSEGAYPAIPQIACFDTAFHSRMPEVAKRLPIPKSFSENGIRRYGFHGLSYESIVSQLGPLLSGKCIIAHLGNGCSMVALKDGIPQDTTMSLTPAGGLMMGTRSGDLDPGVVFYLLSQTAPAERILNFESGLLGVSGISRDMEELLKIETESAPAQEAVELFCRTARKFIGSLSAVLNGLDTLVFTGGMGENSPLIRQRICEGLGFLKIQLEPILNQANSSVISCASSGCTVRAQHTDENLVMAKHAFSLLDRIVKEGAA